MAIYFFTIYTFVFLGYVYSRLDRNLKKIMLFLVTSFSSVIIGLRYNVGVDWDNYVIIFERLSGDFSVFFQPDPSYKIINVLSDYYGLGMVGVMFFTTLLFFIFTLYGARYCKVNPFYFFSLVAPYHFVMSGMNYTRQSIALSAFILSLGFLLEKKKFLFILTIFLASSFHTSSIVLLFLVAIDWRKRYLIGICITLLPIAIYMILMRYQLYMETGMENAGLLLRLSFIAIPTFYFIVNISTIFKMELFYKRLYLLSIFSIPILMSFYFISPVISDRFSYYFILLTSILCMRFSESYNSHVIKLPTLNIMFNYGMFVLVIWCIYSSHSSDYVFNSYILYLIR